jgi:N-acetylglucosamine kinase-like BadF-type ATPase
MINKSIYIFDAGGTKTDVLVHNGIKTEVISLSGYNPNRLDTYFNREVVNLDIPEDSKIYFYGSGINNQIAIKQVKNLFRSTDITVEGDILGAARACLKKEKGIVCIMGTGGISAYYDGNSIVQKNGGYGYLIDDFGGALELSKIIVSNWLNQNYSEATTKAIETYFEIPIKDFIPLFYQDKNLHALAGVCTILNELAVNDSILNESLSNYFDIFVSRHVLPLCKRTDVFTVSLVGSISIHFESHINKSMTDNGITISKSIQKPIFELLDFHLI